ncbi:hypothetical protein Pfo_001501 [Paulownia fortunei]|nr:hypothetical protein Pfo_001501 [Paulownia fortunei]
MWSLICPDHPRTSPSLRFSIHRGPEVSSSGATPMLLCFPLGGSDRQSKNYDQATKVYLSRVAERTRSKTDAYYETFAEAHGISSSSQNVEATNASHGSGGVSAPIARRKRKTIVGQLQDYSSSCKNVNKAGLDGVSAPHDCRRQKKRRIQLKPTRGVGRRKNNFGNNNGDMDLEEIEIERIDVAEFKNKKTRSTSEIGLSTWQELNEGFSAASSWKNVDSVSKKLSADLYRYFSPEDVSHDSDQGLFVQKGKNTDNMVCKDIEIENTGGVEFSTKKTHSMSKIRPPTWQGINEGHFAASSSKNVGGASKNIFCRSFSPEDADPRFDQRSPDKSSSIVKKGNDNEDMDFEGIEIERIEEAEFMNQKTHFLSKMGPSTKEELNGGYCATTPRKDVGSVSKKSSSADCCGFSCPKDACHGFDQAWPHESSSFVGRGSDSEDMVSEEIEIQKIDEAEFRNQKTHFVSKIRPSTAQELTEGHSAASSGKNISSADLCVSFSPEDCGTDSDPVLDKSSPLVKKGNKNECMRSKEINMEGIDEAEFKKEISRFASKIGSSTRQGVDERYSAANSWKNADVVKEVSFDDCCRSFSSEDAGRDSDKGQTDKSSSFTEKGNNNEDMDPEKIGIEKIDESEFRNKRTHFVSKIRSSTRQELNEGPFAATSGENVNSVSKKIFSTEKIDESKKKRKVSAYSRRKKFFEDWNRNFNDHINNSLFECISSYSSSHSNSDNINDFPQDDKISLYGARHEINLGIASRTRSKMRIIKKPSEVDNVSVDLSDDSDSSSTDGEFYSFDDEDFEVESSYNSGEVELLCSYVEACEVQNNILMEVSAEKSEVCSKLERSAVKHASKRRHFSNLQDKEKNCEEPTLQRRQFSLRKTQLSHDSSSKQTKGEKAPKTYEVHEEYEAKNSILGDDANAEEGLKERINGKRDNLPKFIYSKQSYTQSDCDEAEGADGLHPKDQSQAGIRRQKKAVSPSHSEDDCVLEKFDATSSDFHGHGKNEKVDVADEIKKPTKRKQNACRFCIGKGPMLETKESDEEARQAPASQTQDTLPLKFRFEDEVPKEVEKTEYEREMEGLFAELDFNWALEELGSFNYPEVDQEIGNPPAEETHYARCTRGKHELVLHDDQGLICIYCHHVELGPRDVLPQWVEKTYQESERKRYFETEQLLEFDGLHLQSSINNFADFSITANGTVWSIKPGIQESMYKHQQEGFEFLWKNLAGSINLDELKSTDPGGVGGCIISHAPGTGKTRLTIVFIETYLKLFPNCRPVIIAPASMLLTWEEEFRKWNVEFPFLNLNNLEFLGKENKSALRLLAGAKRRNKRTIRMVKIYSWDMGRSILGISYSLFEKLTGEKYIKEKTSKKCERVIIDEEMEKLRKILLEKPGLVVLDEGHTPRNQRSNIWNVLLKLHTEKRVILSGTPFQNNFAELFNTLRIVRPAIADKIQRGNSQSTLISEEVDRAVEKLKISMLPFVHVHKGTILQQSLPGLRDCVVLLKPPALQKSLIERLEGSPSTFQFEHKVALISVHPYLFQHSDSTEEQRIGIDLGAVEASKLNPNEGVKTKFILELVRLSMAMNEKVLIFSQYIQPLELIKEQLKEIFKWVDGKQILQMQGKLDQKQRQILINIFNDPQSESKIMLASTRCCSEGISLVGASRVVLLDVVWNPSVERQAICRAYRIGQKKFVYTYHLMTSGTTEADKYCRQAEKERLSELVFTSSSNESNIEKHPCLGIEDRILEEMVGHAKLKEMFEKIINQPKDTDLIQTFGLTS